MQTHRERRAAALEAIANALLELAAVEREPEDSPPAEILIDRRNCEQELGLAPRAFLEAAGREFSAFRVSRRTTASKADVLGWLRSHTIDAKPPRPRTVREPVAANPDQFLDAVHARFVACVGRPMTDDELYEADVWIDAGRTLRAQIDAGRLRCTEPGGYRDDTPDEVAERIRSQIGGEPVRHADWRSLGVDPVDMEHRAEQLRERLRTERPEFGWRERAGAVHEMWSEITEPLYEARRAARAAASAARKAQKTKSEFGSKT